MTDARASGSGEAGFDEIYTRAGSDLNAIPWAALTPQPALVAWLDRQDQPGPSGSPGQIRPAVPERTALIVACGLGDDAEEVGLRGYRVTAFDLVPAAIEHCRERFPNSAVSYQVADLFRLPGGWGRAFDLVVEIRTLQSLPVAQRADAAAVIAGTVRPGGRLFVHGLGRADGDPLGSRPWPLSRRELGAFTAAGLRETEWIDEATGSTSGRRTFTAVYARP
jgi:SAM-dependent methyltransferase